MQQDAQSFLWGQLCAIALVLLSTLITFYVPVLHDIHSTAAFLVAVTIAAWYCGLIPSITVMVLSGFAFCYFIAPPSGFRIESKEDINRLFLYLLVASLVVYSHWAKSRAERTRRSTERRLQLALDAARMGAWDLDLERGRFWWSPNLERIFGRAPGTFSNTYEGFLGYIHPDDRDFVDRAVTRTIENGVDYEIEHRIVRPDGAVRWITTRGRIFYNERSNPERMIGVVTDISNQHKSDEAVALTIEPPRPLKIDPQRPMDAMRQSAAPSPA
jgi:PAS domain S-box-containing protein